MCEWEGPECIPSLSHGWVILKAYSSSKHSVQWWSVLQRLCEVYVHHSSKESGRLLLKKPLIMTSKGVNRWERKESQIMGRKSILATQYSSAIKQQMMRRTNNETVTSSTCGVKAWWGEKRAYIENHMAGHKINMTPTKKKVEEVSRLEVHGTLVTGKLRTEREWKSSAI